MNRTAINAAARKLVDLDAKKFWKLGPEKRAQVIAAFMGALSDEERQDIWADALPGWATVMTRLLQQGDLLAIGMAAANAVRDQIYCWIEEAELEAETLRREDQDAAAEDEQYDTWRAYA